MKPAVKITVWLLAGLLAVLGLVHFSAQKNGRAPAVQQLASAPSDTRPQSAGLPAPAGAVGPSPAAFPTLEKIKDSTAPLAGRYAAVAGLAKENLDETRLAALLDYIKSPLYWDEAGADQARSLRNNILNILRDSKIDAGPIIAALADLARDRYQDPGLRDYALQHMTEWMPQIAGEARARVEATLRESLNWKEETYAGTGLIGLSHLTDEKLLSADFAVEGALRQIVLSGDYSYESRMTAMAIAGERKVRDAALVKLAAQWAQDEKILVGARRAAQTYLKRIGTNQG